MLYRFPIKCRSVIKDLLIKYNDCSFVYPHCMFWLENNQLLCFKMHAKNIE